MHRGDQIGDELFGLPVVLVEIEPGQGRAVPRDCLRPLPEQRALAETGRSLDDDRSLVVGQEPVDNMGALNLPAMLPWLIELCLYGPAGFHDGLIERSGWGAMVCAISINRLCPSSSTGIFLLLRPVCCNHREKGIEPAAVAARAGDAGPSIPGRLQRFLAAFCAVGNPLVQRRSRHSNPRVAGIAASHPEPGLRSLAVGAYGNRIDGLSYKRYANAAMRMLSDKKNIGMRVIQWEVLE